MPLYGYARVSTRDQDLAAQDAELMAAGCAKVFKEKVSGAKTDRPELAKAIGRLGSGDVLVVTRLDRLARSTRDLLNVLAEIGKRDAGFKSLKDTWADTTTPHGRLMLTVLGGLAEFERELIRARTGEGRKRAKDRGVKFGRPRKTPLRCFQELACEMDTYREDPILDTRAATAAKAAGEPFSVSKAGREALKLWIDPLAAYLAKRRPPRGLEQVLRGLDHQQLALMALRSILDQIHVGWTRTGRTSARSRIPTCCSASSWAVRFAMSLSSPGCSLPRDGSRPARIPGPAMLAWATFGALIGGTGNAPDAGIGYGSPSLSCPALIPMSAASRASRPSIRRRWTPSPRRTCSIIRSIGHR